MKRHLLIPALLALGACAANPDDVARKAQDALAENRFAEARLHSIAALKHKPGDRALMLIQARALLALGDGEGAASVLARLTGGQAAGGTLAELSAEAALLRGREEDVAAHLGSSTSVEAERLRALVALIQNRPDEAAAHFEHSAKSGGSARSLADFARFKLLGQDREGAAALAGQALAKDAEDLDALLVSGQIAVAGGDLARALQHYEKAARIYPDSLTAFTGKAAVLGDLGRLAEMEQAINRAASFAPGDLTVVYLGARLGQMRQQWSTVRDFVQPVEARIPAGHPLRLLYGEALVKLGQPALGLAQLNTILREQPRNRLARRIAAEAMLATGDARGALATIRPIADAAEARPEELAVAARAATAAADGSAAGYEARSKSPAIQVLMADLSEGDAAMKASDWARAIHAYERVQAATDGRNAMVLNNMAYSQLMVGNLPKAREFAERALVLAPEDGSVLDTAGWIEFRSGRDRGRALALLRKAAARSPGNQTIRAHLAEAGRAPN